MTDAGSSRDRGKSKVPSGTTFCNAGSSVHVHDQVCIRICDADFLGLDFRLPCVYVKPYPLPRLGRGEFRPTWRPLLELGRRLPLRLCHPAGPWKKTMIRGRPPGAASHMELVSSDTG